MKKIKRFSSVVSFFSEENDHIKVNPLYLEYAYGDPDAEKAMNRHMNLKPYNPGISRGKFKKANPDMFPYQRIEFKKDTIPLGRGYMKPGQLLSKQKLRKNENAYRDSEIGYISRQENLQFIPYGILNPKYRTKETGSHQDIHGYKVKRPIISRLRS